jgi:general stress protein 26
VKGVAVTNSEPARYDVEWRDVFGAYYKTSVSDPQNANLAVQAIESAAKVKSPVKPRTISAVKTNLTAVAVDVEIVK